MESSTEPNWGKMKRLIILDAPFRTTPWRAYAELEFREVNMSHYWKSEVEDIVTHELVACRFAV